MDADASSSVKIPGADLINLDSCGGIVFFCLTHHAIEPMFAMVGDLTVAVCEDCFLDEMIATHKELGEAEAK